MGTYTISVNATLDYWPNSEPVTLTVAVEVEDCVPELSKVGALVDYVWNAERRVGPGVEDGYVWPDLVIDAPYWEMDPVCDIAVEKVATGLEDWMTYDSAAN